MVQQTGFDISQGWKSIKKELEAYSKILVKVLAFRSNLLDTLIAYLPEQEQPVILREKLVFLQELLYAKCILKKSITVHRGHCYRYEQYKELRLKLKISRWCNPYQKKLEAIIKGPVAGTTIRLL